MVNATYTRAPTKEFFGTIRDTTSWRSSAAVNRPSHGLFQFIFFELDQLATIRQHRWKQRLKISQVATMNK